MHTGYIGDVIETIVVLFTEYESYGTKNTNRKIQIYSGKIFANQEKNLINVIYIFILVVIFCPLL